MEKKGEGKLEVGVKVEVGGRLRGSRWFQLRRCSAASESLSPG